MSVPRRFTLVALLVVLAAAGAATATAGPMIVLYGTPDTTAAIMRTAAADALPIDGRVFIQEPNHGHLFAGDRDRPYRLHRVTGSELVAARTARRMAALLRRRIDAPDCVFSGVSMGCRSHLVFVDEIDHRFAERAPNLNTPAWRGRTSRSQPVRKFPNYIPRSRPGQPGHEFGRAMVILARTRYPSGGSYADRVHLYIAPGVVSSLGVGRGPFHNLGRDRRPHFRSYVGARAAFRRAGGVWLEMYHFDRATRTRYPFNTYEWAVYPWRFAQYMSGPRATRPTAVTLRHLHFMMTRGMPTAKGGAPAACLGAAAPMDCQFTLASSAKNAAILGNGVGAYRMEGQEAAWRVWVRRLFFT